MKPKPLRKKNKINFDGTTKIDYDSRNSGFNYTIERKLVHGQMVDVKVYEATPLPLTYTPLVDFDNILGVDVDNILGVTIEEAPF